MHPAEADAVQNFNPDVNISWSSSSNAVNAGATAPANFVADGGSEGERS